VPTRTTVEEVESSIPGAMPAREGKASRIEDLQRVTDAALAHLDLEDLLAELLERVTEILAADTAAILLVEEDGETLAARAAKGLEEEVERGFRLPIGAGFAGRVASTRAPVVISDLNDSEIEVVNPLIREKGVRSLLGVPLIVEGRLVGVLHVGTLRMRKFDEDDVHLLTLVADRAALAIERARLAPQHRIAMRLQQSLLPRSLPVIPGISLAARYLPGAREATVGGDWYDVIPLAERGLGLVIGDVVGKGVEAAAFMGQLRSALRAYALEGAGPAELVTKLSRFLDLQREGQMATLVYGVLDLEGSTLTFARAGHPYPLLATPDGRVRFLDRALGPPLGTGPRAIYGEERIELERGSTLFLYTDGLIERRGRQMEESEANLATIVAAAPLDPELLCATVLERTGVGAREEDDVAVLAVQAIGLENPLR
jgi:serine phosphatase RsbU (regulator of sigma subunit)